MRIIKNVYKACLFQYRLFALYMQIICYATHEHQSTAHIHSPSWVHLAMLSSHHVLVTLGFVYFAAFLALSIMTQGVV